MPTKWKLVILEQKLISSIQVRINFPTGEYYSIQTYPFVAMRLKKKKQEGVLKNCSVIYCSKLLQPL